MSPILLLVLKYVLSICSMWVFASVQTCGSVMVCDVAIYSIGEGTSAPSCVAKSGLNRRPHAHNSAPSSKAASPHRCASRLVLQPPGSPRTLALDRKIRHQRDRTGTIKNEKGKGRTALESYSASRLVVYDVMVALFSTVLVACLTRLSHT